MSKLRERMELYLGGELTKADYIVSNYNCFHSSLFEYSTYLDETAISNIFIESGRVIFKFKGSGILMTCPPGDHRVAPIETINFRDYERNEAWMIERLVNDGDVVYDIGANMGYYGILLALKYQNAKIHCFEPVPSTFEFCKENIALNKVPNILCNNFGLSDKEGTFPFYIYPEGSGNASAVDVSGRSEVFEVTCKLDTIDQYTQKSGSKVDFIKCDVEGGELFTFLGGDETISRDLPIIFSEILRKYCKKYGYDHNEIFEWFYEKGYKAFTVKDCKLSPFRYMDDETVATNFFFLHSDKHAAIIDELQSL